MAELRREEDDTEEGPPERIWAFDRFAGPLVGVILSESVRVDVSDVVDRIMRRGRVVLKAMVLVVVVIAFVGVLDPGSFPCAVEC